MDMDAKKVMISNNYKMLGAHRVSWELHNGKIPEGLFVCHKCDNPICVNPEHLFLGTQLDNMADRKNKGRYVFPPEFKGEHHIHAKLNNRLVAEIKSIKNMSVNRIAKAYSVNRSTIQNILDGTTWRDVKPKHVD